MSGPSPTPPGSAPANPTDANFQMMQMVLQHQQQQFFQALQQHQQSLLTALHQQSASSAPPLAAAQLLALTSLGQLRPFAGGADATGLAAREWLTHAEYYLAARESALGVSAADGTPFRIHAARAALTDDALRWLTALPQPPTDWAAFRTAFLQRFSSVPAAQVREAQLQRFVDSARRVREKLTVDGMQRYTTLFLQYASEIPAERMTDATKRSWYAQGLPPRYAEFVLLEDAKERPPPLHEVAQQVLAKATLKAHAAHSTSGATASAAGHRVDAMDLDAISLCATQFGISQGEAARYFEGQEGWVPHDTMPGDTNPDRRGGTTTATVAATQSEDQQLSRLLAAFEARYSNRPPAGRRPSLRRNVPIGVRSDIPEALAAARKEAGLCVKCGVVKYEPGSKGHNSRTCQAPADKTTSAAEGKKKANF